MSSSSASSEVLIVGAGAIGLALAYELSSRGCRITLVDRGRPGRETSWAGAGILPPANRATALHPVEQLRAVSHEMHAAWAARLLEETAIDVGYRRCGGIYVARSAGEAAVLHAMSQTLAEEQIECHRLDAAQLAEREPQLAIGATPSIRASYWLPGECQLRNPRYLQALEAACRLRGVQIIEDAEVTEMTVRDDRMTEVVTSVGRFRADQYVVTAGPWTQRLLAAVHVPSGIIPIRGQMILFRCNVPPLRHILNEGSRYLVPRDDGYLLAGSTEEEVGFDNSTTPAGIDDLTQFAREWVPALGDAEIERTWAGLRPASFDGFPYIGRLPHLSNAFTAAGHFRSGLHLSPGTALLLAQLMLGETPVVDPTPFRVGRGG